MSLRRHSGMAIALGGGVALLLLLYLQGIPPGVAMVELVRGAFGNALAWTNTLRLFAPLAICGLGLALAFRAGHFNIGAEGQFVVGGLAAALVSGLGTSWPLALLAGALAGGLWASVAAFAEVRRSVPLVLSTIMLNFIALELLRYAVTGPLQEPTAQFPQTATIPDAATLPTWRWTELLGVHLGVPLAVVLCLGAGLLLHRTRAGLLLRALGSSPGSVQVAGFPTGRLTLGILGISGACAGLAGSVEVTGVARVADLSLASGLGYAAIAVALLARNHPGGVLPAALFLAALRVGTASLQWVADVPGLDRFALVAQGVVILMVLLHLRLREARRPDATPLRRQEATHG